MKVGDIVDSRYKLVRPLGAGAMGQVFLAEDVGSGEQVALKTVNEELITGDGLGRFESEFNAIKEIQHPNTVRMLGFNKRYFTMEFVDGEVLDPAKRLLMAEVLRIGAEVCRALNFIHRKGIIHGDLKPAHILLTKKAKKEGAEHDATEGDGYVKLIDFGLSRPAAGAAVTVKEDVKIEGTIEYMAPEQIKGLGKDTRSDLYSFGVLLYEMLTGRLPFQGNDFLTIALGHLNKTPEALSRVNPDIPPQLEALVLRLLHKNPHHRPQTAEEVGRRLVELMGGREARETVVLKGRQYLFSPSFVGREREMEVLNAYLGKALQMNGCCVMVHGGSGIGKRRFMREFRADHLLDEMVFLSGTGSPSPAPSGQYYAELLSQAFHVLERLNAKFLSEKVWEWGIMLARLGPKSIPEWYLENLQHAISAEPALMARNIAELLISIGAYRPLVMTVENLQFSDRFGCELFEILVKACDKRPVFLLAAYRDEPGVRETPFTRMLAHLQKNKQIVEVRLKPLDRKNVELMISSMMGHAEVARQIGEEVSRVTGGNPLFAEEVIKSFADQEIIFRVGSQWRVDEKLLEDYAIPGNVEDVIFDRAMMLGPKHREVVEALSVIRWAADFETLMTLTRMTQLDLYYILGDLVSEGILKESRRPGGKNYRFSSERVRQYFYSRMDARMRVRCHEQMARVVEAQHENALDLVLDDLIYHYGGCGNNRKLLECLLRAGNRAETEVSLNAALQYYERALDVISEQTDDAKRRAAVLGEIARLTCEIGDLNKARVHFETGLRTVEKDTIEAAQLARDMGQMFLVSGDSERAEECFRFAEKVLARHGIEDALLHTNMGEYHLHTDNLKAAEECLIKARRVARSTDDRAALVRANELMGTTLLRKGKTEEGITVLQEGLSAAERSNSVRLRLRALSALIRAMVYLGRIDKASTYIFGVQELAAQCDSRLDFLSYLLAAGEFYLRKGQLDTAQEFLDRCLSVAKEVGEKRKVADAYALLGTLNIERDDLKVGIELCERGLNIARSLNSKYRMAQIAWLLGGAFLTKGEYDTAQEFLGHSRRLFDMIGVERELSQVFHLLGEVHYRKRELFTARQFLTMAIDRANLQDDWAILGRAQRILARIYMEEDDIAGARRSYEESIAIFERHDDVLGLARSCQDFGLFLLEYDTRNGDTPSQAGMEYLGRAHDLYRSSNAEFLARKTEVLLNKFRRKVKSAELDAGEGIVRENIAVDEIRESVRKTFDAILNDAHTLGETGEITMPSDRLPEKYLEEVQTRINEAQGTFYKQLDRVTEQNRRLQQDLEFLMEEKNNLALLQEISRTINSELDMNRLINKILDMVIEVLQAERGFLILKDSEGKLVIRVARNIDRDTIKKPEFKVSFSISKRVMKTGETILTSNAQEDARFKDKISVHDLKLKSVLCVPFKSKDQILGAVYVDNRFVSGLFGEKDLELLTAFSNQAAIALENARLYEENLNKQKEVEELNQRLQQKVNTQEVELAKVKSVLEDSQKQLGLKYDYSKIIGRSRAMQEVLHLLDRIIDTHVPVLIQGESGTGKELVARAVHYNGSLKDKPFAAENCAALPETLLESELFGYKRGAFTGADRDKKGLFEIANGGTLFLDEVAEMSENMQKKFLRVLQEGEIRPVGGKEYIKVKVRIISATNKDLKTLMQKGQFREDLYYRLNVVTINLPPLRERPEDIPLLVEHFLTKIAQETGRPKPEITPEVISFLERYKWPGNVRELENELNRLVALSDRVIRKDSLSLNIRLLEEPGVAPEQETAWWRNRTLKDIEREAILNTLRTVSNNKVEAARILEIDRTTLYNKMKRYGIEE